MALAKSGAGIPSETVQWRSPGLCHRRGSKPISRTASPAPFTPPRADARARPYRHVTTTGARPAAEHAGRRRPLPCRGLPRVGGRRAAREEPALGFGAGSPEEPRGGEPLREPALPRPLWQGEPERRPEGPPLCRLIVNSSSGK